MRRFNDTDWMGLAGAEPFSGFEQAPFIEDVGSCLLVGDRSGLTIHYMSDDGEEDTWWTMDVPDNEIAVHWIMERLMEQVRSGIAMNTKQEVHGFCIVRGFKLEGN